LLFTIVGNQETSDIWNNYTTNSLWLEYTLPCIERYWCLSNPDLCP